MRYLIGIGNYYGRDDSVGLRVAETVAERGLDRDFATIDLGGTLLDLVHYLDEDSEQVLFVDATRMGLRPGEYRFFTPEEVESGKDLGGLTTHEGDLLRVLGFAAGLGRPLPPVTILGIEPMDTGEGDGLSAPLAARFEEYVAAAVEFVSAVPGQAPEARSDARPSDA